MSESISMVPPYDGTNYHKVLSPNFPVLDSGQNSAHVPPYIGLVTGPVPVPPIGSVPEGPEGPEAPLPDSYAEVVGAGTQPTRGVYSFMSTGLYQKGQYRINKINEYPNPGETAWAILNGSNVYYSAPDSEFPWESTWVMGSFGASPAPTVKIATITRGAKKSKEEKSKQEPEKEEPKKKKRFFNF